MVALLKHAASARLAFLIVPLAKLGLPAAMTLFASIGGICHHHVAANDELPGTARLKESRPIDQVMVAGINRHAVFEIGQAAERRSALWHLDFSSPHSHETSLAPYRERFSKIIGAVDRRRAPTGLQLAVTSEHSSLVAENDLFEIHAVRWPVLDGIDAEGLWLRPRASIVARIVAIPDADWTPEMVVGLAACPTRFAADLAAAGCEVLVPVLVDRGSEFSGNPTIGKLTNLTHREFIYRQAFELGRHVIGYEVQKILAGVDQLERRNEQLGRVPIGVVGASEGGLLALYSGAIDQRIDGVLVSGYFTRRDEIWREPIYRNVWGLLREFGDAELAGMIAPRFLHIEQNVKIPEVTGPKAEGRKVAAPGNIESPKPDQVGTEWNRAGKHWQQMSHWESGGVNHSLRDAEGGLPLQRTQIAHFVSQLARVEQPMIADFEIGPDQRHAFDSADRQRRTVKQMTTFTQRLLQLSHRARDVRWGTADRTSVDAWNADAQDLRDYVHDELIGRLPDPSLAANPRSRRVLSQDGLTGYEIVLDVFPDVIAAGILLVPDSLDPSRQHPVIVCQHGLEGTPMDTISGPQSKSYQAYKSFSLDLAKRGYIVYAPQNPYRGGDAFRGIQRKANPLGRSLFSYIIAQHRVTLRWLASLPYVDRDRIGFYGLSYGGKTAVRVPPLLPPSESEPGYALSICSADFNEWVAKNASTGAPFSYIWTPEYEIFEWNMGHVANYAELAMLMAPRPFMVERGHDDGVGIDEWVAWEFAKVRRHYDRLGVGNRTEIEFFNGPHTINGVRSFDFLREHIGR